MWSFDCSRLDPDNLSRAKPTVAEWLHWLVLNIPASNLYEGLLGGNVVMPYGSPVPQPRTDKHRLVLLLWEHGGRLGRVTHLQSPLFTIKTHRLQQAGRSRQVQCEEVYGEVRPQRAHRRQLPDHRAQRLKKRFSL